ncbi:hypothetical protein [Catelliglobosispora koreensis]|uniref:hypothetical protein n=1 Tax=Catelliglobosispora koreensis TaxID=129052 RepID=UPI00036A7C7E|nr:hypothetical protein [Catelliglobosispora koreensis]
MPVSAPHEDEIQAMLTEALAQYRAHPDDYLEGLVLGLMRALNMDPDRSWYDDAAQNGNAETTPPAQRVRDYINGLKAAGAWALGTQDAPPVQEVLTAGQPPSSYPPETRE